jgi:cephalosporin hydroxylase
MNDHDKIKEFEEERRLRIEGNPKEADLVRAANDFMTASTKRKYSYNFTWLGRPIIQYPQDIVAMQEIVWRVRPDLIVETGVAHGGSVIFYASMMELIGQNGLVIGIDIEVRKHNRIEIEKHPLARRIKLIEASSVNVATLSQVREEALKRKCVMVVLDSNHTHQHVLNELKLYSPLVTSGSYCVVFDTIINYVPDGTYSDRPWSGADNPATAIREFLTSNQDFEIDHEIDNKLLISVASGGFLRRKQSDTTTPQPVR